jgi:hypothetical protein
MGLPLAFAPRLIIQLSGGCQILTSTNRAPRRGGLIDKSPDSNEFEAFCFVPNLLRKVCNSEQPCSSLAR